jgi:hypothetical protein
MKNYAAFAELQWNKPSVRRPSSLQRFSKTGNTLWIRQRNAIEQNRSASILAFIEPCETEAKFDQDDTGKKNMGGFVVTRCCY